MLTMTSKTLKEVVQKMHLPVVVQRKDNWDPIFNKFMIQKTDEQMHEERQLVLRQLVAMTDRWHIVTLSLPNLFPVCNGCAIRDPGTERFAEVLSQCAALAHLDLSCNRIEAAGAATLLGVLSHCTALVHLNLSDNSNSISSAGAAERLAGVLAQCTALAHLNLKHCDIGDAGTDRFRECCRSAQR